MLVIYEQTGLMLFYAISLLKLKKNEISLILVAQKSMVNCESEKKNQSDNTRMIDRDQLLLIIFEELPNIYRVKIECCPRKKHSAFAFSVSISNVD